MQREFICEILNHQKSNHQNGAVAGDLQWCNVIGYCTYVNIVNILSFAFLLILLVLFCLSLMNSPYGYEFGSSFVVGNVHLNDDTHYG